MERTFGQRLAIIRKSQGLSQSVLAKRCGLHPNAIYLYETDRVNPSFFIASCIAEALGVSLDWLAGREDTRWIDTLLDKHITP